MNKEIMNFVQLAMSAHYQQNGLEKVNESLKSIFDASDVCFHKTYIKGNIRGSIYLPVSVNGKNIGYYRVIGARKKVSDEEFKFIVNILSQLYSNIDDYDKLLSKNNIDDDTELYNVNGLISYCDNIDLSLVIRLNCLFIRIDDYKEIINYSGSNASQLIKGVADMMKQVFNLSNDVIFRYTNNQFVIFVANQSSGPLSERIAYLENYLKSIGINIEYGVSFAYRDIDLYELIYLAQRNIDDKKIGFRK